MDEDLTLRRVHQILSDCEADKAFYLANGTYLRNLHELADALKYMDSNTFLAHVNESKNDFYNWVLDVIEDEMLAERIKNIREKEMMARTIEQRIKELEGVEVRLEHLQEDAELKRGEPEEELPIDLENEAGGDTFAEKKGFEEPGQAEPGESNEELKSIFEERPKLTIPEAPSLEHLNEKPALENFFRIGARDFLFGLGVGFLVGLIIAAFF